MDGSQVLLVVLKLLAVAALVLLNGFFVATEFALVKVRRTQLAPLMARGHRRAALAWHLTQHLDAYLSACQLGITLASLGLGWIGEPVFAFLLQPVFALFQVESETARYSLAFGVGFSVITFLHIVVGEMAPKSLAIRLSLPTSLWVAYPMRVFYVVMYPVIWVLNESALRLLRGLGLQPAREIETAHTEDELRLLLAGTQSHAGVSRLGRELVLNALELRHRIARDVMRPRQDIVALDTEFSLAQCLDVAEKSRYSRYPLCEGGDLDRTLGVVHIKDLYAMRLQARTAAELRPLARKLLYVPETAHLDKVLQLFLERRLHMAIVVDEYGVTVGLLTLENVLEELVGQIQDEFDQESPLLLARDARTWQVAGALPLHELAELVGQPLAAEGITTVSGLVTLRLGGFPKVGDTIRLGDWELQVEEMDGPRVARLVLSKPGESRPAPGPPK